MAVNGSESRLGVLIVDDAAFYRKLLRRCVTDLPGVQVVGTASNGRIALGKIEYLKPDFVILDIEMPELGGLEALEQIRLRWPGIGVVIVSGQARNAAEMTVRALARGALDFVAKPAGGQADDNLQQLRKGLSEVLTAFRASRARAADTPSLPTAPAHVASARAAPDKVAQVRLKAGASPAVADIPKQARLSSQQVGAIGIAASTGGPQLLMKLIPMLPGDLSVPVFIVQHMPPMFTAELARSLDRNAPLSVCEACDGQIIEPGRAYLAPGGQHMVVRRSGTPTNTGALSIGLNSGPPVHGCRPAADVLFRSLATIYQARALVIVMTGMGSDGMEGVSAVKKQGGGCITQSAESCVVYGMPKAVVERGLSDEALPPELIVSRIRQLVR